ncbi:holin, SPP1 family [Alteribacillus persepolensis]|uniref:Holin, SPP1 family n=1 Tax=Alteribacillus persepolensis TaxID=568899 RepID=A0A1G8IBW5_9BACI|nr:phage holin [Alteribacillus persepolensis]SDI16469.1 holin, SPP1 family [Alteribacillus persepolensis]
MDKGTLTRTIVLVAALMNQILAAFGKSPLPFSQEEIEQGVSACITVVAAIWTWFKNNYITEKGKRQKEAIEKAGAQ